jgi:hypothetical protein
MDAGNSESGVDWRLRASAIAFVVAALMTLPALFTVHPPTDLSHNRAFAIGADSLSYRLGSSLQIYALAPLMLAFLALYSLLAATASRRLAVWAAAVTLGSALVFMPIAGFGLWLMPAAGVLLHHGRDTDVLPLLDQIFTELEFFPGFLAAITLHLGFFLFALAIWRSGSLTPWLGVPLAAEALISLVAFLDVQAAQRIQPALSGVTYLVLAAALWLRAQVKTTKRQGV